VVSLQQLRSIEAPIYVFWQYLKIFDAATSGFTAY